MKQLTTPARQVELDGIVGTQPIEINGRSVGGRVPATEPSGSSAQRGT